MMATKVTSAVVGMTFGREHVVAWIDEGDPALLVPEPDNPHDPNAIAVHTCPAGALPDAQHDGDRWVLSDADRRMLTDRHAGYLPREVAARMHLPVPAVGTVSRVRYHEGQPAGFDVTFDPKDDR